MDLENGFPIEKPCVVVPWMISTGELKALFGGSLRHVTDSYYTLSCITLGGMEHQLGFHFYPKENGRLTELEFFRRSYENQKESYDEFQCYIVAAFGEPSKTHRKPDEYDSHVWNIGNIVITHSVYDRFGPEEHMRVKYIVSE